jgi:hypothetical protein
MLKIGDWVEITPQSDLRWGTWTSSRDVYDRFRSRIGVIDNITIVFVNIIFFFLKNQERLYTAA